MEKKDQKFDAVFNYEQFTIIACAAGGVGGFRDWHYVANGADESLDCVMQDGYFNLLGGQIASQDRVYVAGAGYSASLVFEKKSGDDTVRTLKAWSVDLSDEAADPAVQTLPVGGSNTLSGQA